MSKELGYIENARFGLIDGHENICRFCEHSDDLSGMTDEEIDMKDMAYCYVGVDSNRVPRMLCYGSPGDGYDGQSNVVKINYCPMCGRKLSNL